MLSADSDAQRLHQTRLKYIPKKVTRRKTPYLHIDRPPSFSEPATSNRSFPFRRTLRRKKTFPKSSEGTVKSVNNELQINAASKCQ